MVTARSAHPSGSPRFLPAGAVTGVGSLACTTPAEAVSFVAEYAPELPFVPQPPAPDGPEESICDQIRQLQHRCGRHHDWFEAFRAAVAAGAFPGARALKLQVTGPLTLARLGSVTASDTRRTAAIGRQVSELAIWMLRRLRPSGLPVVVTVDEPALGASGPADTARALDLLGAVGREIAASGGTPGVHSCSGTGPSDLVDSAASLISFDPSQRTPPTAADLAALADPSLLVAFGLTTPAARGQQSGFATWLSYTATAGSPRPAEDLAARTIVTPTCGLGAVSSSDCERAFGAAAEASAVIGRVVGGGRRAGAGGAALDPRSPS